MDPIGVHHFYGFSPALDIQQLGRTIFGASCAAGSASSGVNDVSGLDTSPLNILLVQPGDVRSVLKTIAQRFRHCRRPLHVSFML
jgi:hypothetical protein